MLDKRRDKLATLNNRFELLRHSPLDEEALLRSLRVGERDVNGARLGGDDLGLALEAVLGEVDLTRVGGVDGDGRDLTKDLDGE